LGDALVGEALGADAGGVGEDVEAGAESQVVALPGDRAPSEGEVGSGGVGLGAFPLPGDARDRGGRGSGGDEPPVPGVGGEPGEQVFVAAEDGDGPGFRAADADGDGPVGVCPDVGAVDGEQVGGGQAGAEAGADHGEQRVPFVVAVLSVRPADERVDVGGGVRVRLRA